MSVELACSECEGRLLVEQFGVVVACPHCGAHLSIPAELGSAAPAEPPPAKTVAEPSPVELPPTEAAVETPVKTPADNPTASDSGGLPDFMKPAAPLSSIVLTRTKDAPPAPVVGPVASESAPSAIPVAVHADTNEGGSAILPNFTNLSQSTDNGEAAPEPPMVTAPTSPPTQRESASPKDDTVAIRRQRSRVKTLSNLSFQVWLSYTIIMTFTVALLLYKLLGTSDNRLESLPDVVPPVDNRGEVVGQFAEKRASMPQGHTLKLGETQRFGNIEVTPLRVTREPLEFVHYQTREPRDMATGQVLKLWLRFKNVSDDQTIAPLDRKLVFTRMPNLSDPKNPYTNNFLATPEGKQDGEVVLVYDHVVEGDWDLKQQQLGQKLKPGEELTTYIPTEEEVPADLAGELLWRLHFRKGYSPKGYGVTTLVEVQFTADQIQPGAV